MIYQKKVKLFTSLFQNVAKYQIRNIIFLKYIWPVNKMVDLPKLISSTNVLKWKHVSLTVNDAQMPWHYKWHIWMPVYIPFVNIMQWGGKRKSIVKVLFFFQSDFITEHNSAWQSMYSCKYQTNKKRKYCLLNTI